MGPLAHKQRLPVSCASLIHKNTRCFVIWNSAHQGCGFWRALVIEELSFHLTVRSERHSRSIA